MFEHIAERDKTLARAADLRAGLIAATYVNMHRKKGARLVQPGDFIRGPRRYMSIDEAQNFMDKWAHGVNATHGEDNA